jgi:hypothetical protein
MHKRKTNQGIHVSTRDRLATEPRPGTVLIVVLVVIVMLSLAGYTFTELMYAEHAAAVAHGRSLQARSNCF